MPVTLPSWRRRSDIAMIGCGQYAFSTIGYFLQRRFGKCVGKCYDIHPLAAETFARFYSAQAVNDPDEIFQDPGIRYVYIASNHATHVEYALKALAHRKVVYVEKPVAVNYEQLRDLKAAVENRPAMISFGFNRPFAKAMDTLNKSFPVQPLPITLSCFITGHVIGADHWYRHKDEGTRICGNVGHWLDLAVHILSWRGLPDRWQITLTSANSKVRDDDLSIVLVSERSDLISIVLTSRAEPFEGVNESINLQVGDLIAKIDDFREIKIWRGDKFQRQRVWPKDVGHARAILQPFDGAGRDWSEIEASALLVLHIKEMVESATPFSSFSFMEARSLVSSGKVPQATSPVISIFR